LIIRAFIRQPTRTTLTQEETATTNMAAALANACIRNGTGYFCDILDGMDAWLPWHDVVGYFSYNPWIFSLLGSTMVGLTGIFPLWLIPIEDGVDLKTGGE